MKKFIKYIEGISANSNDVKLISKYGFKNWILSFIPKLVFFILILVGFLYFFKTYDIKWGGLEIKEKEKASVSAIK